MAQKLFGQRRGRADGLETARTRAHGPPLPQQLHVHANGQGPAVHLPRSLSVSVCRSCCCQAASAENDP
eukprot:4552137-Lingulodinium_polyedra.AAC.1